MSYRRKFLFACFALLSIAGCVHIQRHPKTWDPPSPELGPGVCPPISGVYENLGVDTKGVQANLAQLISYSIRHDPSGAQERNRTWKELKTVRSVELKMSDDGVLTVTAISNEGIKTWSFASKMGQFNCEKGVLRLHQSGDGSGDNVVAYESATLDLFRVDNDLVVHKHGGSAGVMLLIPAAFYESTWARFAPQPAH